jgi:antirestriction protein ArdC
MPCNLAKQRPYRGINFWLLSASEYASPYWLTLRQANELGGHVRQGEHSQIVVFWKIDRVADDAEVEPEVENVEVPKSSRRFVLRYYRVWNLEQWNCRRSSMTDCRKAKLISTIPLRLPSA